MKGTVQRFETQTNENIYARLKLYAQLAKKDAENKKTEDEANDKRRKEK